MKKQMQIFILLILFVNIFSEQCDKYTGTPTKENDCFNQLSDSQKDDLKKTHCCHFQAENLVDPKCISLTQTQYDNIEDYIKYNEILWGYVNLKINCNSFYLGVAIFEIILLFILYN